MGNASRLNDLTARYRDPAALASAIVAHYLAVGERERVDLVAAMAVEIGALHALRAMPSPATTKGGQP